MNIYQIIFIYLLDYFIKKSHYLDSFCYYFYFVYFIFYCYFIVLFRQPFCYFSDIWDDNTTNGGMNHTIISFLHFILHDIALLKGRMCVCVCSQLCSTLCDLMYCSPSGQAPPSMEFSRQEYWSELPFPSPEDVPASGIKSISPALAGRFFTTEPSGKPHQLTLLNDIYRSYNQ